MQLTTSRKSWVSRASTHSSDQTGMQSSSKRVRYPNRKENATKRNLAAAGLVFLLLATMCKASENKAVLDKLQTNVNNLAKKALLNQSRLDDISNQITSSGNSNRKKRLESEQTDLKEIKENASKLAERMKGTIDHVMGQLATEKDFQKLQEMKNTVNAIIADDLKLVPKRTEIVNKTPALLFNGGLLRNLGAPATKGYRKGYAQMTDPGVLDKNGNPIIEFKRRLAESESPGFSLLWLPLVLLLLALVYVVVRRFKATKRSKIYRDTKEADSRISDLDSIVIVRD